MPTICIRKSLARGFTAALAASALTSLGVTPATAAGTYTILHRFNDGSVANDAATPSSALIQGSDGNFYGTSTPGGGVSSPPANSAGFGTIYRITPAGQVTVLHHFGDGSIRNDGAAPVGRLVQAPDGNFYGMTTAGGSTVASDPGHYGYGTIFRMTPAGQMAILHNFGDGSTPNDGKVPSSGLTLASDGCLYGTTLRGGLIRVGNGSGSGVVFKISLTGQYSILHRFEDGSSAIDGRNPQWAKLVQAKDGSLYGTTWLGGVFDKGAIYKMSLSGKVTVLHSFNDTDGFRPDAGITVGTDGNLYGTTSVGGPATNFAQPSGVIYKMTPSGQYTVLHSFPDTSLPNDGSYPAAPLIQASDGNLYGACLSDTGELFSITPAGQVTILHNVGAGTDDGRSIYFGLVQGSDGNLYGTATAGGVRIPRTAPGFGAVFQLALGLPAPKPEISGFAPLSGLGGSTVTITGVNVIGTTAVKFDGVPATSFHVVSPTTIMAAVPRQATTGPISITTQGGTVSSAGAFTVIPTPSIRALSATSGGVGAIITITGSNLLGATSVKFNGVTAPSFRVQSDTNIAAAVPAGATTGPLTVTTPVATASGGTFTVIQPPSINAIAPASGAIGSTITITGTNFGSATAVKIGGALAASFTVVSPTTIAAVVPKRAMTGVVTVTTAANAAAFTVTP